MRWQLHVARQVERKLKRLVPKDQRLILAAMDRAPGRPVALAVSLQYDPPPARVGAQSSARRRMGAWRARSASRARPAQRLRRQELGRAGEARAASYLEDLGWEIVARNYRCRGGEVDLVAVDDGVLAFVEVKTRRGARFGSPLEAVDERKQRRMITAALSFLATRRGAGMVARFDVVGIRWDEDAPRLEHVRNAFQLD